MRRLLSASLVALTPAVALATPPPLRLHDAHGHALPRVETPLVAPLTKELIPLAASAIDVSAIDYDVSVDPASGAAQGSVKVTLSSATASLSGLLLYMDPGLSVQSATAPGTTVNFSEQDQFGYRYVSLSYGPVATGTPLTIDVTFAGTLKCEENNGRKSCNMGGPMPFLLQGSAIPGVYDQFQIGGYNAWGAKRTLTLHLPSGMQAFASGDLQNESSASGTTSRTWVTPGYPSAGGYLVVMGDLTEVPSTGTSPPVAIVHAKSAPSFGTSMAGWMQTILPFVDGQAGTPLPYAKLKVVKLPVGLAFPGTAGHAITLLSESYGGYGDDYFEETLAHENVHQWWGVLVSPGDLPVTRWLTEGLATQAQIEYRGRTLTGDAREAFLARRYREHHMLLRYHTDPTTLPSLVAPSPQSLPGDQVGYTVWAYIKSSATLEHLRVMLGDAIYAQVLAKYAKDCAQTECTSASFQQIAEQVSGKSLDAFMGQFVYQTSLPELTLSFSQAPKGEGFEVTVTPENAAGLELELELWLTLEDGSVQRRAVVFPKNGGPITVDAPARVRSVKPNPRHDGVIWSRSAQSGDVDFDGEVDGFDLIACARRVGTDTGLYQEGGEGLWQMNLDFDVRCDAIGDGQMKDDDLAPLLAAFGTVKEATP